MYKDVRAAVDLCHRDGTLKQMVARDPKRQVLGGDFYFLSSSHYHQSLMSQLNGV